LRLVDALRDAAGDALARLAPPLRHRAAGVRTRDALTGLLLRPTWLRRAARRLRARTSGAVLLFDLAGLAYLNHTLGPAAGDACLIAFARLLDRTARGGLAGRFGGDKFMVLVDGEARAAEIAEQVRVAMPLLFCAERTRVVAQYPELAPSAVLSVSVGAARHRDGVTIDRLVELAEHALGEAKTAGHDCVRWAD
jgi:diguanylate cyclase (GGDEF)-like protein